MNREDWVSSVYSYLKLVELLSRIIASLRGSVTFILLFSIPFFSPSRARSFIVALLGQLKGIFTRSSRFGLQDWITNNQ